MKSPTEVNHQIDKAFDEIFGKPKQGKSAKKKRETRNPNWIDRPFTRTINVTCK